MSKPSNDCVISIFKLALVPQGSDERWPLIVSTLGYDTL